MRRLAQIVFYMALGMFILCTLLYASIPTIDSYVLVKNTTCNSNKEEISITNLSDSVIYQIFKQEDIVLPIDHYLDNINRCKLAIYEADLCYLKDSLGFDASIEKTFFNYIEQSVDLPNTLNKAVFDPLSLSNLISMAETSQFYYTTNLKNRKFHRAMARFCLNNVSNNLSSLSDKKPDLKYNLNFKILEDRCNQNNYQVDVHFSTTEKLINYLVEKEYAYILNRLWISIPPILKLILLLLIIGTIAAYIYSIKNLFSIKNTHKNA